MASLPMRGEWIEIDRSGTRPAAAQSLPMRGEWIEINHEFDSQSNITSLPMRGEWIEIFSGPNDATYSAVSPHAGRVD